MLIRSANQAARPRRTSGRRSACRRRAFYAHDPGPRPTDASPQDSGRAEIWGGMEASQDSSNTPLDSRNLHALACVPRGSLPPPSHTLGAAARALARGARSCVTPTTSRTPPSGLVRERRPGPPRATSPPRLMRQHEQSRSHHCAQPPHATTHHARLPLRPPSGRDPASRDAFCARLTLPPTRGVVHAPVARPPPQGANYDECHGSRLGAAVAFALAAPRRPAAWNSTRRRPPLQNDVLRGAPLPSAAPAARRRRRSPRPPPDMRLLRRGRC